MKTRRLGWTILLLLAGCVRQESQFEQILRTEDQRLACEQLEPFLSDLEPRVRVRAIEAIGRIQTPGCTPALHRMLDDANHNVRAAAAFALGQIGNPDSEARLITKIRAKDIVAVKVRLLEALGKLGSEASMPTLLKQLSSLESALRAEAALSVGRFALRQITEQSLTDSVTALLQDPNARVRWQAAYALMRVAEGLDPVRLQQALNDDEPLVRMYAVQALGGLQSYKLLEPIADLLRHDPDWRVRASAAKVLGKYPLTLTSNYLSLLDQLQPVRVAIIQAIGLGATSEPDGFRANNRELNWARGQLEQVMGLAHGSATWTQPEIGHALVSYAQLMGEAGITALVQFAGHGSPIVQARAMQALGLIDSPAAARLLQQHYESVPARAKIEILQSLSQMKALSSSRIFLQALQENDHVLVGLAAEGLGVDSLSSKEYGKRILDAYLRLPKPIDSEAVQSIFGALASLKEESAIPALTQALLADDPVIRQAAADALTQITGNADLAEKQVQGSSNKRYDYSDIFDLADARALIVTSRGKIEIGLFADDAPLTVLNFVRLSESGFYDSVLFHRVVPNFVIQAGDPRGDGWGSPGYAIRSEFNKRNYTRGTVGMASAGKDTEGSQFFITHSPQPHLDGRYTVFGQVISGMEIVDAIQEGDTIDSISIHRRHSLTKL